MRIAYVGITLKRRGLLYNNNNIIVIKSFSGWVFRERKLKLLTKLLGCNTPTFRRQASAPKNQKKRNEFRKILFFFILSEHPGAPPPWLRCRQCCRRHRCRCRRCRRRRTRCRRPCRRPQSPPSR